MEVVFCRTLLHLTIYSSSHMWFALPSVHHYQHYSRAVTGILHVIIISGGMEIVQEMNIYQKNSKGFKILAGCLLKGTYYQTFNKSITLWAFQTFLKIMTMFHGRRQSETRAASCVVTVPAILELTDWVMLKLMPFQDITGQNASSWP